MIQKDQFASSLTDGTTLSATAGVIEIADEGVTEAKDGHIQRADLVAMC